MKFMSMVIAVLLYAAFAGWANADPRIELDSDSCHFPWNAAETDDEYKLNCPSALLVETAQDGAVFGWAFEKRTDIPRWQVPVSEWIQSWDSNAVCTLRNDDGTETTIERWYVRVKATCPADPETRCEVIYELTCGNQHPHSYQNS